MLILPRRESPPLVKQRGKRPASTRRPLCRSHIEFGRDNSSAFSRSPSLVRTCMTFAYPGVSTPSYPFSIVRGTDGSSSRLLQASASVQSPTVTLPPHTHAALMLSRADHPYVRRRRSDIPTCGGGLKTPTPASQGSNSDNESLNFYPGSSALLRWTSPHTVPHSPSLNHPAPNPRHLSLLPSPSWLLA